MGSGPARGYQSPFFPRPPRPRGPPGPTAAPPGPLLKGTSEWAGRYRVARPGDLRVSCGWPSPLGQRRIGRFGPESAGRSASYGNDSFLASLVHEDVVTPYKVKSNEETIFATRALDGSDVGSQFDLGSDASPCIDAQVIMTDAPKTR
jgi:hypothetical protein